MIRFRRRVAPALAAVVLGLVGAVSLGPLAPAQAEPGLSVAGLQPEPGRLRFAMAVRDLPSGDAVDPGTVAVGAGGTGLPVRAAVRVATSGGTEQAQRRLAVLVLDASGSMAGAPIAAARTAALDYVRALPPDVDLAVVEVSTSAQTALAPTSDRAAVRRSLNGMRADGNTALYDGIALATRLGAEAGRYDQRRVVVLSDGEDTTSRASLTQVRRAVADADAPVDTVAFRTGAATTGVLAALSRETDGRAYSAADARALSGAFRSAAGAFGVQLLVTVEVPEGLAGKRSQLDVAVRAGDRTLRASVPVTFAAARTVSTGMSPLALGLLIGSGVLVFLALLTIGLLMFSPLFDRNRQQRRLAQVNQFAAARQVKGVPAEAEGPVARAALALTERVVRSGGLQERIARQLDRAAMRLRPHEWLLLQALVGVACGLLSGLLLGPLFTPFTGRFLGPVLGVLAGAGLGWAGTVVYQQHRISRRARAFGALLPDALQLVIGSLRSGFSLSQAINATTQELPDPLSTEFGRAVAETRLGVNLEDALSRVAARMNSVELAWAVVAVRVQREVGGNLAEVLDTTVATIRERGSLRRHVRSLAAEGRLSAWVLLAMPIGVGAFMFVFRGDYLRPLYTEPVGIAMLVAAVAQLAIGGFWLSRMVKVEI